MRSMSVLMSVSAALSSPAPSRTLVAVLKVSVTSMERTIVRSRWWQYQYKAYEMPIPE